MKHEGSVSVAQIAHSCVLCQEEITLHEQSGKADWVREAIHNKFFSEEIFNLCRQIFVVGHLRIYFIFLLFGKLYL